MMTQLSGGWFARKVILAYVIGSVLLLGSSAVLKLAPTRGLENTVFALAPRPEGRGTAEADKAKIREALGKLPSILAKLGFALLGVAAVARVVRSIEPEVETDESNPIVDPPIEGSGRRGWIKLADWAVPAALAVLVFVQVAPTMDRPLFGDELENYEQHLTLPLKGTLTTMGGANNQLGFSILAWVSIRVFGDSPASVRLPAILGAVLLPVVAYRYGLKDFGRSGATVLGLLLALWPDVVMAGMQGRSYSLLMLFAIAHLSYFKRFATTADRRSGLLFAITLAVACTLHLWFVIVAGSELLFLGLLKVADRFRLDVVGVRTPLRIETFLLFMTLGGLGAATVQAGILPKFAFILTQKSPDPVDAGVVLASMAESLQGMSFMADTVLASYRGSSGMAMLRTAINLVALVGLGASVWGARKDPNTRFLIAFFGAVAATFFLAVYARKPVYLYSRFFAVLPMILAWSCARGWGLLLDSKLGLGPTSTTGTVAA